MIKCIRCGCKYDLHSSRSSNLTVHTYSKSSKLCTINTDAMITVTNLCNECTKSLFTWLGGPLKGEEDRNADTL